MTENEVTEIINRVASRYAYKFKFGFYTPEDIRQEAFIIAMEALDRYDESRPLENFLAVHVKNRLNNFKRDKFYRQNKDGQNDKREQRNNSKKFLMEPLDIDNIRDEHEDNMKLESDLISNLTKKEVFELIDTHLDVSFRGDYLRIKHGAYVPKPRREQVFSEITEILREHGYEEG